MRGKTRNLLFALFSGLLLSLSWYANLSIVIFFAFVPLLLLEEDLGSLKNYKLKVFGLSYLTFLIWNVLVTWWVYCVQFGKEGALLAFICNSLLMATVFMVYAVMRRKIRHRWNHLILIPVWIAWEHIHTLWDISWTWLTLGNVFAFRHNWVQWYEFTGTSGGTLWVLAVNLFVFDLVRKNKIRKLFSRPVLNLSLLIIVPVLLSYLVYFLRKDLHLSAEKKKVLVVQPNIDPYSEKFYVEYAQQFNKMLEMVRGKIDANTEYLVLPETFITGIGDELNESQINNYLEIQWFRDSLIRKFPNLKIVTGANTYKFYERGKGSATARTDRNSGLQYDMFNTGIFIDGSRCETYHKSKLVPGVERMPFPALFKPLEKLAINMGGTVGSLGLQDERTVFAASDGKTAVAPVICYESVYADYVAEYIRNGANLIFIITNDGWWEDTPGYVQHLHYGRLRAIENRREIARSANTGISCFIDHLGNIHQPGPWWEETVIEREMHPISELTFFSKFGDLISYFSVLMSLSLILLALFFALRRQPAP